MERLNVIDLLSGIRFGSYKSFSHEAPYLFSMGQNITLTIGCNNSGKSSLIDVIEAVISEATTRKLPDNMLNVCPSFVLDDEHIKSEFPETTINSVETAKANGLDVFEYLCWCSGRSQPPTIISQMNFLKE